ncbi:MAG: adenosylcobinamide-GDP ribazoletransferase [Alphaproteobacteria bacterium]|nr:adenosylcobinamide-GDP ribazoletransferase [Alphaproteobacteria bacterium]
MAERGEIPDEGLTRWRRDLSVSVAFLTRIPVAATDPDRDEPLARSMAAFPLVGAGIGLMAAAVFALAGAVGSGPWIAALAAVAATVLITGALHEDGLADVADAFGGGADSGAKLDIMRDSRLGAYGVLALIFSVALRTAALATLAAPWSVAAALIAAHAAARAAMPAMMDRLAPARADGLGATAGTPPRRSVTTALALGAALTLLFLGPLAGLFAILLAAAAGWLLVVIARRQIGGYTGDVLGAMEQAVEMAVLVAAVIAA